MKCLPGLSIIFPAFVCCQNQTGTSSSNQPNPAHHKDENPYAQIMQIPVPEAYERISLPASSFGQWLRQLKLKADKTVYLYNGLPKNNQEAQFAVIDLPVGKKDLQQCADAVMRLRAEYFYRSGSIDSIRFRDNGNNLYAFAGGEKDKFNNYLELVFTKCGTLSLEKQLRKRKDIKEMQIGDVLIKGGSPGHAMIFVDMAVNKEGKKIFLLAQSYMPAQQMHVVINPINKALSPWYSAESVELIITPEWTFRSTQLYTW